MNWFFFFAVVWIFFFFLKCGILKINKGKEKKRKIIIIKKKQTNKEGQEDTEFALEPGLDFSAVHASLPAVPPPPAHSPTERFPLLASNHRSPLLSPSASQAHPGGSYLGRRGSLSPCRGSGDTRGSADLSPGPPYSIRPRCLRAACAPGGAAIYRESALEKDF